MADTTFVVDGVTYTFDKGQVKSIRSEITVNLDNESLAISGPMQAMLFDFEGALKKITIDGVIIAATTTRTSLGTTTTILSQKQWLESILNGNQSLITFSSTYEAKSVTTSRTPTSGDPKLATFANTKVMASIIEFTNEGGNPNALPFKIVLFVGGI